VGHRVDPRDRRLPRLGHADGEDNGLAVVEAVGGLQCETVLVTPGRLPPASVPDLDARTLGKGGQPTGHLGP